MLVLSRKTGETVRIADDIEVIVLDVSHGRVKLGFAAPRDIPVRRGEMLSRREEPDWALVEIGAAVGAHS